VRKKCPKSDTWEPVHVRCPFNPVSTCNSALAAHLNKKIKKIKKIKKSCD
jgi:hypothetical protein